MVGAIGGLIVSAVVVLNLHIVVGLEHGYSAGPREVWDASPLLALADVGLLTAGPAVGAVVVSRWSSTWGSRQRR
jgi:hypothetical protein